jgi:hypothetical protein
MEDKNIIGLDDRGRNIITPIFIGILYGSFATPASHATACNELGAMAEQVATN